MGGESVDVANFLKEVVTGKSGWFCLGIAEIRSTEEDTQKSWREEFFSWPDELPSILNRIAELGTDYDYYFSPYLFTDQTSQKTNAIVGRTIVADLDFADVITLQRKPTVLVETSPDRHQAYWILKDEIDAEEHEALSKKITYSIPRCDKTGWFLGKKVRIPDTYNHKYTTGPKDVRIVDFTGLYYTQEELNSIASGQQLYGPSFDPKKIEQLETNFDWAYQALKITTGPQELLASVRSHIQSRTYVQYSTVMPDRSTALWALTTSLFRAGFTRDKVFYVAYHGANNKFKELRYGGIIELAKDVIRAEQAVKIQLPDIRSRIKDARKLGGTPIERSEYIAKQVRDYLLKLGSFVHTNDDSVWYIREDAGRPVHILPRSEQLVVMLDNIFGINGAERESFYIANNLYSYGKDLPITGRIGTLSVYDTDTRTFMLHTGRKDILLVKDSGISRVINGYSGVVFPWSVASTPISPMYKNMDEKWDDVLFDGCLDNILEMNKDHAKAILKVWLLTVLLRDGLTSRPILALFGQPGSGKSTLFRRVYTVLYGRDRAIGSVTNENNFDQAMSVDPLVVLDNVDTWERWLPDRLALAAAPSEIVKRRLFTDNETITLRRQAMLGITAHNPKFGREDVTDRLLLLNFERLKHFVSDSEILDRIVQKRNELWGAILQDIQTVLKTDMPYSGYPQFRIEDFSRYGYWIACALGIEKEFSAGLVSIRKEQKSFNLEEDALLIEAIDRYLLNDSNTIELMPAGSMWIKLKQYAADERGFSKRYSNAVSLGRKLWTLLDALKEVYEVEWDLDSKRGTRLWTIKRKVEKEADNYVTA